MKQVAHGSIASTTDSGRRKGSLFSYGIKRLFSMLDNNLWLLSGMAVGLATLVIAWWIASDQWAGRARSQGPDPLEFSQPDVAGSRDIEKLEEQLTGLNDRLKMLTDSITYLESKLIRAHVIVDSIISAEQKHASSISPEQPISAEAVQVVEKLPPSAAGQTVRDEGFGETPRSVSAEFTTAPQNATVIGAARSTTERPPVRQPTIKVLPKAPDAPGTDTMMDKQSNTGTVAVTLPQAPISKKFPTLNPSKGGAWVINLTSSPSQVDADRFAAKAQSMGIETQQQQVTVKGTQYWRVQTTGFSTVDEAQAYAGTVREKLGLKDTWITRR
jgi:hypothetical protein